MPGLYSAGFPVLEGDYSDYSIYDTFKDTDGFDGYMKQDAIFNQEETQILLLDGAIEVAKAYIIATKTLGAAIKSDISFYAGCGAGVGVSRKSAYGRYVVVLGYTTSYNTCDKIHIFKNGALLKTLEDSELGITDNKVASVAISPKGKYIIISGYITAESDMGWVVLEGS